MLLMDEEKLVTLAASGDCDAFEQLIEKYSLPLARFVSRLTGNPEDARDVVQQVLLLVYQSLPDLQNPAYFRAWLFKIARNKSFESLRRKSSRPFPTFAGQNGIEAEEEDESEETLVVDPGPLPLELVERQETRQLLQAAINRLPVRTRQVVILRYTTDLTFGEIAQVLDTNENSVKTLFQRGKALLRTYLGQRP